MCGDGVVHAGVESCDDGNDVDGDACLNSCRVAFCGDGILQEGVEECDDGNNLNGDGCLSTCVFAACGDGVVQAGVEAVAMPATTSTRFGSCTTDCVGKLQATARCAPTLRLG